ncbi:MAG: glycerate kinase [Opitutaceae bacterium]|nr:glycerate kinase [Opitutaceae bacterium]
MRVLLAFDKFKDALTAPEACAHAAAALGAGHPDWQLDLCPLADGGEGFCEILTRAAGGTFETHTVTGPRGAPVRAALGLVQLEKIPSAARALLGIENRESKIGSPTTVAVIEMAAASGLALLKPEQRDPWLANSTGTGELLRLAARPGVDAILLGVGGSATSDLGLCALAALGLKFETGAHESVPLPVPLRWPDIARLGGGLPRTLLPIRIACDVSNPLLGPRGAAAIYGPQKGLRPADLPRHEAEAARLAQLLCAHASQPASLVDRPGAGAAGGISFGLMAAAGAQLVPGAELVSAWLDLAPRLAAADLVITGEGRFDDSSLSGKGPGEVASRALALGKNVHVFAGRAAVAQPPPRLALHSITPDGVPLDRALREAGSFLQAAVRAHIG